MSFTNIPTVSDVYQELETYIRNYQYLNGPHSQPEVIEMGEPWFTVLLLEAFKYPPQKPKPPKYESGYVRGSMSGSSRGLFSYGSMSGSMGGKNYQYDFDDPEFRQAQLEFPKRLEEFNKAKQEARDKGELEINFINGPIKIKRAGK